LVVKLNNSMRWYHLNEEYAIDNVDGWGAVPNNQEVDYLGLRVKMTPRNFIKLAAPLGQDPSEEMISYIKQNKPIGAPFLIVSIPAEWEDGDFSEPARILGHEGRNRMTTIQALHGDHPLEVHLFFTDGMRARHLTPEMIENMNSGMVKEKSRRVIPGPLFKAV